MGIKQKKQMMCLLKGSLFPRSRAAVRPLHPGFIMAAWAKQPLLKDSLFPRSRACRGKAMGRMGVMRIMGIKQKKQMICMLKDSLFPRSRAAARPVMLAAWAKQPLLKDSLFPRSRTVVRLVMLAAWAKQPLLKEALISRSQQLVRSVRYVRDICPL